MKFRLSFIIGLMAIGLSALAQDAFYNIVNRIADNNIELKALTSQLEADKTGLTTNNNLSDPELEFEHQWGQRHIGNKWSVGVSQSFEWPGLYGARRRANSASANLLNCQLATRKADVRLAISESLINYVYAEKLAALYGRMKTNVDTMLAVAGRGAAVGEVSRLDVGKIRIEQALVERRLNQAEADHRKALSELNVLNGDSSATVFLAGLHDYASTVIPSLSECIALAENSSPEVVESRAAVETARLNLDVAGGQSRPGFSLGYNHDYELGDHFNGIKVGVTLPLFSARGKKAEAQMRVMSAQQSREDAGLAARLTVDEVYTSIARLDDEISRLGDAVRNSETHRLLDVALKARHITLAEYFSQVNYILEAEAELLDIEHQRALAVAKLGRLTGGW